MTLIFCSCIVSFQNELLPASDRMPPQTSKKVSGPYDRKHLMDHLTKQAAQSKVGEDYIPFVKKAADPKVGRDDGTCGWVGWRM